MLLSNPYRPDPRVKREAIALRDEGYEILLLAWDREDRFPQSENLEGIEVRRIKLKATYDNFLESLIKLPLLWLRMLIRLLRDRFEIVHCHDLDTLPVGLFVARLKGKPCVFDAHELYSAMVSESVSKGVMSLLRWMEGTMVRRPELVITVNETLSRIYRQMGSRNVIVVMNCPLPEELGAGDPESVVRKLGLEGKKVCLYAGMLEKSRNLDTLIEVFDTLEDENTVLLLGGYGTLIDHVLSRVSVSRNIIFVGWIRASEKASYVSAADVIVLLDDPSYSVNRLAIVTRLLEAMALGVPVLASEGTLNAEVVQREGIGLCVRHDDVEGIQRALHELLYDAELRNKMIENALRVSQEKYSWETMRMRLIEAYSKYPFVKADGGPTPK